MPLLKKKVFQKAPLPQDLRKNEEVFHCVMTNEIFRDYEEFCQRVILCNSMVWSCSLTGKSGLTYSEALESEQNAQNILKDFPTELRIPVLFLASKTQRTTFLDMANDVFMYAKDRYFIGENVEASFTGNKWRESHVLQVIAPTEQEIKSAPKNGHTSERHFFPPSSLYRYEVEQLDAEDEDVSEVMIVNCEHIKRKKSSYNPDKNKTFLKQFVEQNEYGLCVIKESVLESYGIPKLKFDQFFDGPLPNFEASKRSIKNAMNSKKSKQETLTTFLSKNNGVNSTENTINLLDKMKKRQEQIQQLKEALKQKKADEKLAERQRRKEENIKISMILKEWYKPKEDLELEDQKKIPVPAPVYLKVPDKYVGDVLTIVEFVHSFSKLLYSTDFFPGGLTMELMERALMQKEIAGPLTDVIQMFLSALFNIQNEEAAQCPIEVDNSADIKGRDVNDNVSFTEATYFATIASSWSITHQGLPLNKLPLYSLTTSEILRLHLLSSGARINESGAKWRYQHRGGYTSEDDPALYLRLKQPHILKALALHNITELPIGDKLKIIHCLINQLLTYADIRDTIEDRLEKSKQAKLDIKTVQIAERRRDQEFIGAKLKIKKEGRENNKDVTAEIDRLSKEAERRKGRSDRKMEGLLKTASEHQIMLGQDRAYRKYVKLESIPGLFVNFEEDNPGFCLDEPVEQNPNLVGADRTATIAHVRKIYEEMNASDKENNLHENGHNDNQNKEAKIVNGVYNSLLPVNETDLDSLMMCCAETAKCIVHSTTKPRQKWSFYHTHEQLEQLADSLNKRGVRESELKQAVQSEQDYLANTIAQTPVTQLNPNIEVVETEQKLRPKRHGGKSKYEDVNLGYPIEMNSASVLQFALVDNILEIEEKIYAGNLGCIRVKDRDTWRDHLSNRQYNDFDKNIEKKESSRTLDKIKKDSKNSRPNTPDTSKEYKDPGKFLGPTLEVDSEDSDIDADELPLFQSEDHKLAVQTLAIALIQVGYGVENRYLKKPLGHAGMRNEAKKTEEHDIIERWQQSLLAATSYSQIYLHFSTLDNCILWSRSALLARCTVCRRQTDSENMLLCDNCNKGHHLYCLKPKLTSVPQGDWFCKECQKQKDKEAKLKNPVPEPEPEKKKRRIFKEEMSDEENVESENVTKSKDKNVDSERSKRRSRRIFKEETSDEETYDESESIIKSEVESQESNPSKKKKRREEISDEETSEESEIMVKSEVENDTKMHKKKKPGIFSDDETSEDSENKPESKIEEEIKPVKSKKRGIFSDDETSEDSENIIKSKVGNKRPKQNRKSYGIFSEEETSEESDNSNEEEDDETSLSDEERGVDVYKVDGESQEPSGEDSEKTEVCTKCGVGGTLLCCDHCPEMYHLECAEPPLRRVPRGEWFCHRCRIKKNREALDETYVIGRAAQRSGITYNQRRCAARARHKIHGFAKTLRRISESEDSDGEVVSTRRSRREAESRDDLPLHNAPLQELLAEVLKQDSAWPFLRPVQKTEVPDYYDIITKPMDFGTIKYKLNMGEYKCDADLMVDVVLVFENCNTYNNADDEVYKCGATLLKYFVNKCQELGLKFPEKLMRNGNDDNLEPPALKKMRTK